MSITMSSMKSMKWCWLAAPVAGAVFAVGCGGSDEPTTLTPAQIVDRAGPATVQLSGRFGDGVASGSGAVIDSQRGLVLTNAHVVSGVEGLKAQINDAKTVPARVVAQAPCDDVALVELVAPPADLRAFSLGSSARLKAGQHVAVLGYPGTLEATATGSSSRLTVTDGTVSNPETTAELGPSSPRYPALIQHQAPVNHGNSGGPLVDDFGRLVGLNTLTGAGSDAGNQTQGQYYAIAIDRIKEALLPTLRQRKDIGDLGWTLSAVTTDLLYAYYGESGRELADSVIEYLDAVDETEGLMVLGTDPGSPAERNHFVVGDYITAINGTPVRSVADVCEIIDAKSGGDVLRVSGRLLSSDTPSESFGDEYSEDIRIPRDAVATT